MYTIFIEYKINPCLKQEYIAIHRQIQENIKQTSGVTHYSWKKAVDQDLLFVESIEVNSIELYHEWKRMLKADDSRFPWRPIMHTTVEGRQKFNIWAFEAVPLSELI